MFPSNNYIFLIAGVIAVIDSLDYESAREYFLSILATDGGTPPLSNTAIVRINVTDANDNFPVFGMDVYHVQIAEDVKVGHNILQVIMINTNNTTTVKHNLSCVFLCECLKLIDKIVLCPNKMLMKQSWIEAIPYSIPLH